MNEQQSAQILVADDESAIRRTLDLLLQRRGFGVVAVASGEEALAASQHQQFDLFLLDLMMPGLSGIEVARHIRTLQPNAKILILTGSSPLEGASATQDLAEFDYMLKTASPQDVLQRVAVILGER